MKFAGFLDVARAGLSALLATGSGVLVRIARDVDPATSAEPTEHDAPSPETGRPAPTDGLGDRPGA